MARSEGEKVGVSCDTCDFKLTVEGVAEELEAKRFESVSAQRIGQKFGSLGEGHAYFNRGHRVSTHLTDEEIARYLDTDTDDDPEVRTDGGTDASGRERFERFHDDDLDVAARRDLATGEVQVLVMVGYHHCGHSDRYLASSAKLPADEGGWFETSQCDGCLGTMEMNEEWWPKEDVVS